MKKKIFIAVAAVLVLGLCATALGILIERENSEKNATAPLLALEPELENALTEYLLPQTDSTGIYGDAYTDLDVCHGEGHVIFGMEEKEDTVTLYAYYGVYGYHYVGEALVESGEAGFNPCVLTAKKDGNHYEFVDEVLPEDGTYYGPSIEKMFPAYCRSNALKAFTLYEKELEAGSRKYAKAYLEQSGETAEILPLQELPESPELPISEEGSNALFEAISEYESSEEYEAYCLSEFEMDPVKQKYLYHGKLTVFESWWESGKAAGTGTLHFSRYLPGEKTATDFLLTYDGTKVLPPVTAEIPVAQIAKMQWHAQ